MGRFSMTRRTFAKASAATAAAALLGTPAGAALADEPVASGTSTDSSIKRIRSCCRACGKLECGVWVTVQDGRAIKVEGDESCPTNRGNCCTKSQASMQAAYHPDRLLYPMKRTNPKGEDPGWVRISWDEAITTAAAKFQEIIDKYGGEALFSMGGTSRIWAQQAYAALKVLLGTPNSHVAYEICKGPRHLAGQLTDEFGSAWMETVMTPRVYVQWGTACEYSNYDDSCRTVVDAAQFSDAHILVDPRQGALGKEADYWINIRPGTDDVIALCWTNIVIENELYDDLYLKRWTNAPFLFCADMEPSGEFTKDASGGIDMKTRLLKECDIKEGGSAHRFMVWDSLGNKLTYFDVDTCLWEGETYQPPTTGFTVEQGAHSSGIAEAWFPDPTPFNPVIDPAVYGEFDVTLKDGRTVKARPVWDIYAERCSEYTPQKAEEITGAKADVIEAACLEWATRKDPRYGNGGIHFQLATDQTGNAIHTERALLILCHITGNYDSPAGNRGPTRSVVDGCPATTPMSMPVSTVTSFVKNAKMVGGDKFPVLRYFNKWSEATAVWDAVLTGEPYYIKGGMAQTGNFMNMSNCSYGWEALKQLDFFVVADLWHAPLTDMADILMPAQHWLEIDSPRVSQGSSGGIGATCRAIEPLGESKIDFEITIKMYEAMGKPWNSTLPQYSTWPSVEEQLDYSVRRFEAAPTWAEYKERFQKDGWWEAKDTSPDRWGTYHRYETGGMRQTGAFLELPTDGKPGYMTPTAKCEIWSTIIETYGLEANYDHYKCTIDDCLPKVKEPYVSPVSTPEKFADDNAFNVTTGRRIPVYFHSEHRQLPWCRELWPVPRMEINPIDAERLGIQQGDWVWIENENGKIREVADLYYGIEPGVINLEHTWWYPEISDVGHGWEHSAVNQLVYKQYNDPICGASILRAYDAKVYKATPDNSPFGNPVPCDKSGKPIITSAADPRLKEWLPVYERKE